MNGRSGDDGKGFNSRTWLNCDLAATQLIVWPFGKTTASPWRLSVLKNDISFLLRVVFKTDNDGTLIVANFLLSTQCFFGNSASEGTNRRGVPCGAGVGLGKVFDVLS
jgi:hypothetical protein